MSEHRRDFIIDKLKNSAEPITGTELAGQFEVSRQVIVQDIAILRAEGYNVLATSNGYMMPRAHNEDRLIRTIVSEHSGFDRMEEELRIIVEYGGKVIDVIVEHPIYGEIIGTLMIASMSDIDAFVSKIRGENAKPLSLLTDGEHIHTIEVPSEKIYSLIQNELLERGFIHR